MFLHKRKKKESQIPIFQTLIHLQRLMFLQIAQMETDPHTTFSCNLCQSKSYCALFRRYDRRTTHDKIVAKFCHRHLSIVQTPTEEPRPTCRAWMLDATAAKIQQANDKKLILKTIGKCLLWIKCKKNEIKSHQTLTTSFSTTCLTTLAFNGAREHVRKWPSPWKIVHFRRHIISKIFEWINLRTQKKHC